MGENLVDFVVQIGYNVSDNFFGMEKTNEQGNVYFYKRIAHGVSCV